MKKNMGKADKLIRFIIAIAIGVLYYQDILKGYLGVVLMIFAIIFLITSLISICPLYSIFGIKTCKTEQ